MCRVMSGSNAEQGSEANVQSNESSNAEKGSEANMQSDVWQ